MTEKLKEIESAKTWKQSLTKKNKSVNMLDVVHTHYKHGHLHHESFVCIFIVLFYSFSIKKNNPYCSTVIFVHVF